MGNCQVNTISIQTKLQQVASQNALTSSTDEKGSIIRSMTETWSAGQAESNVSSGHSIQVFIVFLSNKKALKIR